MNYEDEDYVRFYTRDTVGWMALGWEGQTVLSLMLHGKFDRSGVFDCDGHTPSHAVTLVTRLPDDIVERGLARLLESKAWVYRDGKLVWPKFVHAQSCRRSDKARQRESREKRRIEALGECATTGDESSHAVTKRDQPVTPGDSQSQPVTPSLAEPSRAEEEDPPTPFPEVTGTGDGSHPVAPRNGNHLPSAEQIFGAGPATRPDVIQLHEAYKRTFGLEHRKFRGGFDVTAKILAECIDTHGIAACLLVAKHAPEDGMVSGRDDERKQKHTKIAYIFENEDTFARILRAAHEAEGTTGKTVQQRVAEARSR